MKRVIQALLLLAILWLAALPMAVAEPSRLARIAEKGVLVMGTSGNMPPMTMTGEDGRLSGFDIDIGRLMASMLKVRLEVRRLPFTGLIPALRRGDLDVVISNMTITPQRNMQVAFAGPYLESGKCMLTKDESLARVQGKDLNVPETRIAVMQGSTSQRFAGILLPQATLIPVAGPLEGVKLVREGKAGGMLTDYPICLYMQARYPDAGFVSVLSLLTYEPIGIALPAGDSLYLNWTENFLKRLEGTETLKELGQRWLGKAAVPRD